MINNKDDPQIKAGRVYDYYRSVELGLLNAMTPAQWHNRSMIKRIAEAQKRRAFAARQLEGQHR